MFTIGTTVRLRSGSPPMTITVSNDISSDCILFDGGHAVQINSIPNACFEVVVPATARDLGAELGPPRHAKMGAIRITPTQDGIKVSNVWQRGTLDVVQDDARCLILALCDAYALTLPSSAPASPASPALPPPSTPPTPAS